MFNRQTFVTPVPPAGHVRVASFTVTLEQLESWGFPVLETEQCMGSTQIVRDGFTFSDARARAAAARFTRVAIQPQAEWEAELAARLASNAAWHAENAASAAFHRAVTLTA